MPTSFDELLLSARDWAQRAVDWQWLQPQDIRELTTLESRSPESLFVPGTHRPLVAAFFGGTGVGKSSLLNRLAGQPVARTGIERPTSREVSVYLHESVRISSLPNDFPVDQVRMAQHHDDEARQVMWVDMPDIDSVEPHNRELVLEWLPHIDVLIYVVSPERYRDNNGWSLLREHGGDHAWLFVLNQWDRGQDVQYEDFKRLLGTAGFRDPVILRTDCREAVVERRPDDFAALQSLLREISARHVMSQLEARAEHDRLNGLQRGLTQTLDKLGSHTDYQSLESDWDSIWSSAQKDLMTGLEWPMQLTVSSFTQKEANPLVRALELAPSETEANRSQAGMVLWDAWAEGRAADATGQLLITAGERGLPVLPLRTVLASWPGETGRQVLNRGQLMLRQAMARPGNGLQRFSLKLMGFLAVLLPLAALSWTAYQVVKGYYESATLHLDYLGTDFAVHSILLIGIAWLLPWFACNRLKPSLQKSALRGLRTGVASALVASGEGIVERLEQLDSKRGSLMVEATALQNKIGELQTESGDPAKLQELLQRLLPESAAPL